MKRLVFTTLFVACILFMNAQNVGVGTLTPVKLFSVGGTIVVDHDAKNKNGLDSASLLFGSNGLTGISSTKTAAANQHGLDIWTNGFKRFSIAENGNAAIGTSPSGYKLDVAGTLHNSGLLSTDNNLFVNGYAGIGTAANPLYKLLVNGYTRVQGDGTFTGDLTAQGSLSVSGNSNIDGEMMSNSIRSISTIKTDVRAAIGGNIDNSFRLRVYDGNTRLGGDLQATGNTAIGGDPDNNYRLRVYDGNSRFGGDAQVTGNLNAGTINTSTLEVDNTLTIGGKGAVRSNGTSPLRIGFDSKEIDIVVTGQSVVSVTASITDFSGGYDDVRVFVSQFQHDPLGSPLAWERMSISITAVNATNNTCSLKFHNNADGTLVVKGTLYLTTIAKN